LGLVILNISWIEFFLSFASENKACGLPCFVFCLKGRYGLLHNGHPFGEIEGGMERKTRDGYSNLLF